MKQVQVLFTEALPDAAAASLLLFALAYVLVRLLRQRSASQRLLVLEVVFPSALLLLPLCLMPEIGLRSIIEHSSESIEPGVALHSDTHWSAETSTAVPLGLADKEADKEIADTRAKRFLVSVWPLLAAVWLTGSAILLLRFLLQRILLNRRLRRARPVAPEVSQSARELAGSLGIQRTVDVLIHAELEVPIAFGKRIVLPENSITWSQERQRVVLLHELEHIRRYDDLRQGCARIAAAIYWFNPLAWWCYDQLVHTRELACDDSVLRNGVAPSTYARELLALAPRKKSWPSVSTAVVSGHTELRDRIAAVLEANLDKRPTTNRQAFLSLLCSFTLATACAALPWAPSVEISGESKAPVAQTSLYDGNASPVELARLARQTHRRKISDVRLHQLVRMLSDLRAVAPAELGFSPDGPLYGGLPETSPGKEAAKALIAQPRLSLPYLVEALGATEWETRQHAAWALGRIGKRTTAPFLIEALDDNRREVRRIAAWALGEMRARSASSALRSVLDDPDAQVRAQAAHSLGDIRDRDSVPLLVLALSDEEAAVRERAAHALGDVRDRRALDALAEVASTDPSLPVREMAQWAYTQSGG